jgi:hypothetical protein
MENNFWGLELNSSAVIGVQSHRGNRWINYRDVIGAVNYDTALFGLTASEFRIHTTTMGGSVYYPYLPAFDSSWFVPAGGSPQTCGSLCTFEQSVANSTFETTEFSDESQVMAQQYLYDLLETDTALQQSDPLFESFYQENQLSYFGLNNEVRGFISQYYNVDSITTQIISSIREQIDQNKQTILINDSLNYASPVSGYAELRDSLSFQMASLYDSLQSMLTTRDLAVIPFLDSAEVINDTITNSVVTGQNEIFVNGKTLEFLQNGIDTLLTSYEEIMDIANQCLSSGGPAVYRARTLAKLLNDTVTFENNCPQGGGSRKSNN